MGRKFVSFVTWAESLSRLSLGRKFVTCHVGQKELDGLLADICDIRRGEKHVTGPCRAVFLSCFQWDRVVNVTCDIKRGESSKVTT